MRTPSWVSRLAIRWPWAVGAAILATFALSVLGQTPESSPAPPTSRGFWGLVFDNLFTITILLVFLGAILGALINARRRDRVLKDFAGYMVTAILQDARRVFGTLHIYPNGIEMRYEQPYRNTAGNVHNSFILYQAEYPAVRGILRLENQLTPETRQRRLQELQRYYSPTLFRRFGRWGYKQFGVLRDAFLKTFSLLIGQAKRVMPTSTTVGTLLSTQDKQLTDIGSTVLGSLSLMNDPILEQYIGRWCVAEIKEGEAWREIPGILKEYSTDWIELLEASWPREIDLVMPEGTQQMEVPEAHFLLRREGSHLVLENQPPEALELLDVAVEAETRAPVNRAVPPGETVRLEGTGDGAGKLHVRLRVLEPADVILPRTNTLIRHAGRREQISWLQAIGLRRRTLRVRRPRHGGARDDRDSG